MEKPLHLYSHVQANILRMGKQGALPELYRAIVDELKQEALPEADDILLLLETMGEPIIANAQPSSEQQQILQLINATMILLQQDNFYQGVKSYHLNLMKRKPVNNLERKLQSLNFTDVFALVKGFTD